MGGVHHIRSRKAQNDRAGSGKNQWPKIGLTAQRKICEVKILPFDCASLSFSFRELRLSRNFPPLILFISARARPHIGSNSNRLSFFSVSLFVLPSWVQNLPSPPQNFTFMLFSRSCLSFTSYSLLFYLYKYLSTPSFFSGGFITNPLAISHLVLVACTNTNTSYKYQYQFQYPYCRHV